MKKELLAKLLANENITVVSQDVETASFDVKRRVLTMPIWKNDMHVDTEDHLTGHEVGHALYTPADKWMTMAEKSTSGFRTFVNVVEDARIERMVQDRYPGLRRAFINSYNEMLKNGFFGKSKELINTYKLIDRLNVYFKCGTSADVNFSKEETKWIDEIAATRTFEEVVDISTRLYDLAKEEYENEKEAEEELAAKGFGETFEDEDGEFSEDEEFGEDGFNSPGGFDEDEEFGEEETETSGSGEEAEEEDDDKANSDNGNTAGSNPENEGSNPSSPATNTKGGKGGEFDPTAKTDEILNNNIKSEYSDKVDANTTREISNLKLDTKYPIENIISPKEIIDEYTDVGPTLDIGKEMFKVFMNNNRPVINYMVKEFEMKKRASEYSRTHLAKTGVIDPVKMNNYRYSDDIFRKMEVIPEGKNHGLLMYLDWSGSMVNDLLPTVEQLLNLVMFCKQVQIPFRVFAFSDVFQRVDEWGYRVGRTNPENSEETNGLLRILDDTMLLELFNEKMSRTDFNTMCNALIATAGLYMNHYDRKAEDSKYFNIVNRYFRRDGSAPLETPIIPRKMQLGGTPLESAIVGAIPIYKKFKADNRLDIVTTIFLTDGDSHGIQVRNEEGLLVNFQNNYRGLKRLTVTDPDTRKSMRLPPMEYGRESTTFLLNMYNTFTSSNTIGFRILPYNKRHFRSEMWS